MRTNLKQQLAEHRAQLRQFKEQERAIRDFLLLCTPQSTIAYHTGAAAEILRWQASGQFESQGREYPFRPKLLQAALAKMWEEAAFTPESSSNPERPLRYLKKIMVRLLEQQAQNNQAAGVQVTPSCLPQRGKATEAAQPPSRGDTPLPPSRGDFAGTPHNLPQGGKAMDAAQPETPPSDFESAFISVWCRHALDGLRQVNGLDVGHIIQRVAEVQDQPAKFHNDLPQAIEEMLFIEAREKLGEVGLKSLQQEVESWFAEHKEEWGEKTFRETVEEALRERLRERFRLPRLV